MGKAVYHTGDRVMDKAKVRAAIRKLGPEEKSEIFMTVMGWQITPAFEGSTSRWNIVDGSGAFVQELECLGMAGNKPTISFYKERNMHLAWKVHIWALSHLGEYYNWCYKEEVHVYSGAQEKWLNEALYIGVYEEAILLEGHDI
jgi:hypothetical protein